jgi:multidrug efflux pump
LARISRRPDAVFLSDCELLRVQPYSIALALGGLDGKRSVVLIVRREPDANILETIDRVKALLPTLATSISPAIKIQIALDRAGTIRASVRDLEMTLLISIGLVVLVVLLFLRRLRATMIPAVAIPLSLQLGVWPA